MEFFLGQIILGSWGYAPSGFLPCDGALLSVPGGGSNGTYSALYALMGNKFGGESGSTFNLPNLPAPTASNGDPGALQYFICVQDGIWPVQP